MPGFDYDIGVIGGGAAGLTVAAGAARLGAKVLLVEREGRLGGDCLHYGCVPSKTLIAIARRYHQAKQLGLHGLPDVALPPVDFRRIAARIASVIGTIQEHDSEERFCGLGVKVVFGECVLRDEHLAEVDGRRLSAAAWVIATGSSPAVPLLEGLTATPFLTNRDIFSLDALPGRLVVLGAGPVAMEMAQTFCRLGSRVQVVHRGGRILRRDDAVMAAAVQAGLEREGVVFHLNASVTAVRDTGESREVRFVQDGVAQVLATDAVFVATGRTPNVAGLGLDNAGVAFGPKGVEVDARLRTTQRHIYACGDVTGHYQFTHAAGYEGGIVIANAVFRLPRKADYAFFPWCTYTQPELANIGLTEAMAREAGLECRIWTEAFSANDRATAEGETEGLVRLLVGPKGKPLGVQILGHRAGDLLAEWVAALGGQVSLATLASAVHPYPTLGEINKAVAGQVLGEKVFSSAVRKTLRFFFGLKGRACAVPGADDRPAGPDARG
jgi:pyruvate/2-oxoglutarate dehydrogenase complex dihydrolipoamide dehydrogenase (E3) component